MGRKCVRVSPTESQCYCQMCVISVITSSSQLCLHNEHLIDLEELWKSEKETSVSDPVVQLVSRIAWSLS